MPSARYRSAHFLAMRAARPEDRRGPLRHVRRSRARGVRPATTSLVITRSSRSWSAVLKLLGGDVHGDGGILRATHRGAEVLGVDSEEVHGPLIDDELDVAREGLHAGRGPSQRLGVGRFAIWSGDT